LQQGNIPASTRGALSGRTIDMNDRALRNRIIGLGGVGDGIPREEHFVIIPASEVMAIVALANSPQDLEERLARIIVGATAGAARRPVTAGELRATGAMALLLKDAIRPNLVQTLEGGPAFVHAGPFGNIAHGCNSILATRSALALADIVVTEAGFGSGLGAEKFFDIKCRAGGLQPEAAVIVATVRSLKMHGGGDKKNLGAEDLGALERGLPNLEKHVENVRHFGVPAVIALNRRTSDTDAELKVIADFAARLCVPLRSPRCGRRAAPAGNSWRGASHPARQTRRRVPPALPDPSADPREDRHHRSADLRWRRCGLLAGRRSRDRLSRVDRARQHADLHGQDAILAHRRRDEARPAARVPDLGQRSAPVRRSRVYRGAVR
jgi:hypothetical protein